MRQKILIGVFICFIFGFGIAGILIKDTGFSEAENRYLQQMPELSAHEVFEGTFTKDYETYVTDQFIFRNQWIGLKTYGERAMLKTESNGVFFGKDDYLLEDHGQAEFTSSLARLNLMLVDKFVEDNKELVDQNRMWVMLVPTASQILKDKLPPFAAPYDQDVLLSKEKQTLKEAYVDVEEGLKENKSQQIYYHSDHHWTTLGAYYGYEAWAKQAGVEAVPRDQFKVTTVTRSFLGTLNAKVNIPQKPDTIEIYEPKQSNACQVSYGQGENETKSMYDMDKLDTKDKYGVFFGGNQGLIQIKTSIENGRHLLILKDSFANSMVPFLTNHYETIDMVDLRYFNQNMEELMQTDGITDVLLLYNVSNLVTDRNLQKLK